jgi:ferrochelatase
MSFAPEPRLGAETPQRTAVLLCNLGTPEAATPKAVRRYLAEFLSDRRVVEIPRILWWPVLHGVILRTRPAWSARKYASIWTAEGSPLKVWTERQAKLLGGYLGERGHRVTVRCAMRYGSPSIAEGLAALKAQGATRILILPLYPQYSATTTASVSDAVTHWALKVRALPELRFVNRYFDDAGYIAALARRVTDHWQANGRPDKLVLSFHGLPRRNTTLGDPYLDECLATARLLGQRLGLEADAMLVTFQSRLGRAEWLQPYTEPTLVALAREGVKRIDVICPGFTSDCLETLEEIDQQAREAFLRAGGETFHHIACLNDQHEWIAALADLAIRHLQGWPTRADTLPDHPAP